MRKRRKLKAFVLPTIYAIFIFGMIGATFLVSNRMKAKQPEDQTYVNESIVEEDVPVINEAKKIINPFTNEKVTIGKSFYDYNAESEKQENSLTYYDNTYLQNSGVDYILEGNEIFEVVSVLDGTVTNVKEDETLGKTIEIKHENDYITIYQSLSEVSVKKGDVVTQGQVIGKSGSNVIDKDMGNHLHFEFYHKGQVVNPEEYINKEINEEN